ncbi:hypothetical protein [Actinoplanes sp. URMC 104]|uniref:hypothetical protein n=1 Tax=Actinoplanes sp. URMC 104 TaxID=3423409 RepID=UPI003F1C462F
MSRTNINHAQTMLCVRIYRAGAFMNGWAARVFRDPATQETQTVYTTRRQLFSYRTTSKQEPTGGAIVMSLLATAIFAIGLALLVLAGVTFVLEAPTRKLIAMRRERTPVLPSRRKTIRATQRRERARGRG